MIDTEQAMQAFNDRGIQPEDVLVICSQSCVVVSSNFKRDPWVEVMIGQKIKGYAPRSDEATGKNVRKLQLQLEGGEGVEIDVNKRVAFDRHFLEGKVPSTKDKLVEGEADKLGPWLGRYYSRLALPTTLVQEMSKSIAPVLKEWFKQKLKAGPEVGTEIASIYIKWEPDTEMPPYSLDLLFLTNSDEVEKQFALEKHAAILKAIADAHSQIKIGMLDCKLRKATFLTDLDGMARFTEYDYLTSLEEHHKLDIPTDTKYPKK